MKLGPEHQQLKKLIGGWAFRALLQGRPLKIWRQSSPHNWFIEKADSTDFLWHSNDKHPRKLPNLNLFVRTNDSKYTVLPYWGTDSCMPSLSCYILKAKLNHNELSL